MIDSAKEYDELLGWLDGQFDLNVAPESVQGQQVAAVLAQIKEYEDVHFSIPASAV